MTLGVAELPLWYRSLESEKRPIGRRRGVLRLSRDDLSGLIDQSCTRTTDSSPLAFSGDLDRTSLILFTSGTTGVPLGVMLSHRSLAGNAAAKLAAVPQSADDVRLTVLPIAHAYARTCDFGTWLVSGCTLGLTHGIGGLQKLGPLIRPTLINTVPSISRRLLEMPLDEVGLDRVGLLGCGGAPISEDAFHRWRNRGVTVIQGYGLTESGPVIASATPANAAPGLVGDFVAGWEHEIRSGELYVRGPHQMIGYWENPPATKKKIDADGWLRTGDYVQRDPDTGQLRVLGRVDDVIVLENGIKVFPSVIEREVETISAVDHALLVLRASLELWIDAKTRHDELKRTAKEVLDRYQLGRTCAVHFFDTPLSEQSGELTSKGSIRRTKVHQIRFGKKQTMRPQIG